MSTDDVQYIGKYGPGYLERSDDGTPTIPTGPSSAPGDPAPPLGDYSSLSKFGASTPSYRTERRIREEAGPAPGDRPGENNTYTGYATENRELVDSAVADIMAQYADQVSGGGGVSASHRAAIADALEAIAETQATRQAMNRDYGKYHATVEPFNFTAQYIAGEAADYGREAIRANADAQAEGIRIDKDEADNIVSDVAELIGADERSKKAAQERITGANMALEHAAEEAAAQILALEMEENVLRTKASSDAASDKATMQRQQVLSDARFQAQEEAQRDRLEKARAAAAAAAAAARRRRAAARSARDAAVAEAKRNLNLSPAEAGLFGARHYFDEHAGGLNANRKSYVEGAALEAIADFLPPDAPAVYEAFQGALTYEESEIVAGTIDAHNDTRDREQALEDSVASREAIERGGGL